WGAARAVAAAGGEGKGGAGAPLNVASSFSPGVQPAAARRYTEQTVAYAEEHEQLLIASYAATTVAWLRLRAGEWGAAERAARRGLHMGSVVELHATTVLTELAVRRGDPEASELLAGVVARAERTGELQRVAPALELQCEWALTSDAALPVERFERLAAGRPTAHATRIAGWAAVAGIAPTFDQPTPGPHAAMARRDWRAAADAFGA